MRTAALALLVSAGCAERAVFVAPAAVPEELAAAGAEWSHDLLVTRLEGYPPDEFCVISRIRDRGALRYLIHIRIPIGPRHIATQGSEDGAEIETLEIRLRQGEAEGIYADFDHHVRRQGKLKVRFSGSAALATLASSPSH